MVAAATARVAENIASGVGGEVSERRHRGGDDHLAAVVWLIHRSDSEVGSADGVPSAARPAARSRGGGEHLLRDLWRPGRPRGSFVRADRKRSKSAQRSLEDM